MKKSSAPICLPDSSDPNADSMKRDTAVLVGYGPVKEDSTGLNQIIHTIR